LKQAEERFPPCQECKGRLDPGRLLAAASREERVAAGIDAESTFWSYIVSCPGCHAAVTLVECMGGYATSTVADRSAAREVRKRIDSARKNGTLSVELDALMFDPTTAMLLGAPEFVREAVEALQARRLTVDCAVRTDTSEFDRDNFPVPPPRAAACSGSDAVLLAGTILKPVAIFAGQVVYNVEGWRVLVPFRLTEPI